MPEGLAAALDAPAVEVCQVWVLPPDRGKGPREGEAFGCRAINQVESAAEIRRGKGVEVFDVPALIEVLQEGGDLVGDGAALDLGFKNRGSIA
jgi:hypothetical protein